MSRSHSFILIIFLIVLAFPTNSVAFGAGNIASLSKIEGRNWRHGDIEDVLKTVACLKGHKWTSMMIRRVYFGNWLRDYSQAIDVGTLKGVQAGAIRILVWVLSFMSFGYATGEFEVSEERLGTYRPEEHIDNPKDYADNEDARQYDPRLRGPVMPEELAIDPRTGMKNYIANEQGNWATSAAYVKFSLNRSMHFGRMYTSSNNSGNEADLCEALRCLGQGLHCLEDFGAHTNYCELALQELGFAEVFPHTGTNTRMNFRGKHVYPLTTGTFGAVDFLHSVLGEATDHVTQSEIDEVSIALDKASEDQHRGSQPGSDFINLLSKVPGTSALCQEAARLQTASDFQAAQNARFGASSSRGFGDNEFGQAPPSYESHAFPAPATTAMMPQPGNQNASTAAPPKIDVEATVAKIYPIMEFRDRVVRTIAGVVEKIPGLEKLIETISERITIFVMSLLAPFIKPIINSATKQLKMGSSTVVDASGKHQYEPWTDPNCTDPTHSLLSKDHFSNILNTVAGQVASTILQYVAPRIIYAWENPGVPTEQVLSDVVRVFHHPGLRDNNCEIHRKMFQTVQNWVQSLPHKGANLNHILGRESVRAGGNHFGAQHGHGQQGHVQGSSHHIPGQQHPQGSNHPHAGPHGGHPHAPNLPHGGLHGALGGQIHPRPGSGHSGGQGGSFGAFGGLNPNIFGLGSHSKVSGSPLDMLNKKFGGITSNIPGLSSALGSGRRELDSSDVANDYARPSSLEGSSTGVWDQPQGDYNPGQQGQHFNAFDQNEQVPASHSQNPTEYGYQGYGEAPYEAQPPALQYQQQEFEYSYAGHEQFDDSRRYDYSQQ